MAAARRMPDHMFIHFKGKQIEPAIFYFFFQAECSKKCHWFSILLLSPFMTSKIKITVRADGSWKQFCSCICLCMHFEFNISWTSFLKKITMCRRPYCACWNFMGGKIFLLYLDGLIHYSPIHYSFKMKWLKCSWKKTVTTFLWLLSDRKSYLLCLT